MKRLVVLALVLIGAAACDDSETAPSDQNMALFNSILLPGNEIPVVTNVEASGSGTLQFRMNLTRDSAGAVTGATGDFTVFLTGFPANTTLTGAHIHRAPAGVVAPVLISTGIANGEIVLTTGQTSFTRTGVPISAADAQGILDNPGGYYFNVHSTTNTPGVARGQLVRAN